MNPTRKARPNEVSLPYHDSMRRVPLLACPAVLLRSAANPICSTGRQSLGKYGYSSFTTFQNPGQVSVCALRAAWGKHVSVTFHAKLILGQRITFPQLNNTVQLTMS
jgi:hypothetical protein